MRRWVALGVMAVLLMGGIYLFIRPSAHPNAALAQAATGVPADTTAAPLVAPSSDVTREIRETRRFNRYDKDRDGTITRDEYFVSRRKASMRLDLDRDGKLSFDEYNARASKKFIEADASQDAKLSPVEFATTAAKRRARPTPQECPPATDVPREDEG